MKVQWDPEPEPNQHCSQMLVKHAFTVFGLHLPLLDVHVVARQVEKSSKHKHLNDDNQSEHEFNQDLIDF